MTDTSAHTVETITEESLEWLTTGTGILGSGGGGRPRIGYLRLKALMEDDDYPDEVELVSPEDLDPDATVTSVGQIGAPTIGSEKLPKGDEELRTLRTLERVGDCTVDALIPGEIGGANSFSPLIASLLSGLPVVDADAMGRALPELQMDTFFINGQAVNYAALTDEKGNTITYEDIDSPERFEALARAATVELGGTVGYAYPILTGEFVREYSVHHTLSLCHTLGRRVVEAREGNGDPVGEICDVTGGKRLFSGKIHHVKRRHDEGFTTGEVRVNELDGDRTLRVTFQNEFLHAERNGETAATVPDLITMLDSDSAEPILSDEVQFGQRVDVLGIPAPELLTTDRALEVVGPRAFGYDREYEPLR
jgi:DUF917 family protein